MTNTKNKVQKRRKPRSEVLYAQRPIVFETIIMSKRPTDDPQDILAAMFRGQPKRRRSSSNVAAKKAPPTKKKPHRLCSFCEATPASVVVSLSTGTGSKRKVPTPFCWLHYYTTRAVRVVDEKCVEVLKTANDTTTLQEELQQCGVQTIFAEAWTSLKQELVEESVRSFQNQKKDPLAILNSFGRKKKKAAAPSLSSVKTKEGAANSGGFLRQTPLPERYQKAQAKMQAEMEKTHQKKLRKMNPLNLAVSGNPYEKRKASRRPIFSIAMDSSINSKTKAIQPETKCTSCGSTDVMSTGNVMSRNADVAKGDTWGYKDRDEVIVRYNCNSCGKRWNED